MTKVIIYSSCKKSAQCTLKNEKVKKQLTKIAKNGKI